MNDRASPAGTSRSENVHRVSNSRKAIHPYHRQDQHISSPGSSSRFPHWLDAESVKYETHPNQPLLPSSSKSEGDGGGLDGGMHSTSDFVRKLYKMVGDPTLQKIVSWSPAGDCFVVKDMNEFTKSILPRMFKHSNFASFVRQLNKYDFHKVKNADDGQPGEQSWTFRHPSFHADQPNDLENIKRKVPAVRKSVPVPASSSSRPLSPPSSHPSHPFNDNPSYSNAFGLSGPGVTSTTHASSHQISSHQIDAHQLGALQSQAERLAQAQEDLGTHVRKLEREYHDVLVEMVGFQKGMAQQDGLMQSLIGYCLKVEKGGK